MTATEHRVPSRYQPLYRLPDDGRIDIGEASRPVVEVVGRHRLDPTNMHHLDQPLFRLGHGVEDPADGIHGDEEDLYVVELPSRTPFDEPGEWTVKVSEHCGFPRWNGPTEDAFNRTTWQFEGTLTVALEELLAEPA